MVRRLSGAKTFLVLSLRHLGDTVVAAGMVNALSAGFEDIVVDVLGRREMQSVTERFCRVREFIPIEIPVFGHHRKGPGALADAMRKIVALRARRYDVCLNLTGDVRENIIGWMTRARVNAGPSWPKSHPFRRHIRTADIPRVLTFPIPIDESARGYYDSMEDLARQMGATRLFWPENREGARESGQVIALHPGASHESKRWTVEKWKQLIRTLSAEGYHIRLYGSRGEYERLCNEYSEETADCGVDIVGGNISEFISSLSSAALLIGMDSFAVHAAHALGIPTVVLHGPYDPSVMTPPSGVPISAGALCPVFPCYRGKACSNATSKYVCVRGIDVADVRGAVEAVRERLHSGDRS